MGDRTEYHKEYWSNPENRKKNTEAATRYRERNKEKVVDADKKHRKSATRRDWKLRTRYGITFDTLVEMHTEQEGKCWACGRPIATHEEVRQEHEVMACVDHNHTTNEVRVLLCSKCNMAFGLLDEKKETLRKLIILADYKRECKP
jgi:hypothetical protein